MAIVRRFLVGLLKGLVIGGLVGAGAQLGLGWTRTEGLLAYLLAMGIGATVGLLAGKPPWAREAWLESLLRAAGGLVIGAVGYFLVARFAPWPIPLDGGPGAPAGTPWVELPLLFGLAIGATYGALVELDHTPDGSKPPRREKSAPKREERTPAPAKPTKAGGTTAPTKAGADAST